MTIFIIIAILGFLSHLGALLIYGLVNCFSNASAYEPDIEYLVQEQADVSPEQFVDFISDTRLLSFSLMVLGIAGWISSGSFGFSFLKSLLIGITAGLIAEGVGALVFIIREKIRWHSYHRRLSQV